MLQQQAVYCAAGQVSQLDPGHRVRDARVHYWIASTTAARDAEPPSTGDRQRSGELYTVAEPIVGLSASATSC